MMTRKQRTALEAALVCLARLRHLPEGEAIEVARARAAILFATHEDNHALGRRAITAWERTLRNAPAAPPAAPPAAQDADIAPWWLPSDTRPPIADGAPLAVLFNDAPENRTHE